jgi:thioredoxin-dependent peroxiredoxin
MSLDARKLSSLHRLARLALCALGGLLLTACSKEPGPTPAPTGAVGTAAPKAAGAGSGAGAAANPAGLEVGDTAPNFDLMASDGKQHKLSDHVGKEAVVVAWFPKAFTGGCTAQCKSLHDNGETLKKFQVAVYAASVDPPEKNYEFAKSLELDYPILSDPKLEVAKAYGVLNANNMASRWTFYIGKDGKILFIDRQVETAKAGVDVAAKLKELGVPERG